jgi:hypothetical protein
MEKEPAGTPPALFFWAIGGQCAPDNGALGSTTLRSSGTVGVATQPRCAAMAPNAQDNTPVISATLAAVYTADWHRPEGNAFP